MNDVETFGDFLKKIRTEKKLSLRGLSKELNLSHTTVNDLEHNKLSPSLKITKQIATLLKTSKEKEQKLYDLSIENKSEWVVPLDLARYINGNKEVRKKMRKEMEKKQHDNIK